MRVKCRVNRELSSDEKKILRCTIRIPLLHKYTYIHRVPLYVERRLLQRRYFYDNIFTKLQGFFTGIQNVRSLVTAALLIALHTVLAYFVSFQVTPSLRISVSFLANVVTGAMFGPVVGFICGGVGDIVQFVIKPTGPYFWGWTINAALAGLIYGTFLYKKFPRKGKVFDIAFLSVSYWCW